MSGPQGLLRPLEIKLGLALRLALPGGCRVQHRQERRPSLAPQTGGKDLPNRAGERAKEFLPGEAGGSSGSAHARLPSAPRGNVEGPEEPPEEGKGHLGPLRGAAQLLVGCCLSRETPRKGPVEERGAAGRKRLGLPGPASALEAEGEGLGGGCVIWAPVN